MNKILTKLAKLTNPHLSKVIGSSRPVAVDWKLQLPRPEIKVFTEHTADYLLKLQDKKSPPQSFDLRRPYRILCLDGGGVRGILTIALLNRICEAHPTFLDNVDFICGTSAGGILSLLLSAGYSSKECADIYSYAAPHIFGHNPWRSINPFRAKYSDKSKQELMEHYFGKRTMADLTKTCAVVAFRLDGRKSNTHSFFNKEGWRPAVFSNMSRSAGFVEPDLDLMVWDAAMRTSAAPTFFPVFRGYTDGGIVANNPSIIAVSKAMAHNPNVTPRNVVVLSLGAGTFPRYSNVFGSVGREDRTFPHQQKWQWNVNDGDKDTKRREEVETGHTLWRADWGIKQWIPFLLDLLLDGDSITTEMVMHYLLAGNKLYHRLDPSLPRQIALDDVLSMQEMTDFAQTVDIESTLKFVNQNFMFREDDFDNMIHNSLDSATVYHDAWHHVY